MWIKDSDDDYSQARRWVDDPPERALVPVSEAGALSTSGAARMELREVVSRVETLLASNRLGHIRVTAAVDVAGGVALTLSARVPGGLANMRGRPIEEGLELATGCARAFVRIPGNGWEDSSAIAIVW